MALTGDQLPPWTYTVFLTDVLTNVIWFRRTVCFQWVARDFFFLNPLLLRWYPGPPPSGVTSISEQQVCNSATSLLTGRYGLLNGNDPWVTDWAGLLLFWCSANLLCTRINQESLFEDASIHHLQNCHGSASLSIQSLLMEHWKRLSRQFVESPSLEILKPHLDKVLCSLL